MELLWPGIIIINWALVRIITDVIIIIEITHFVFDLCVRLWRFNDGCFAIVLSLVYSIKSVQFIPTLSSSNSCIRKVSMGCALVYMLKLVARTLQRRHNSLQVIVFTDLDLL